MRVRCRLTYRAWISNYILQQNNMMELLIHAIISDELQYIPRNIHTVFPISIRLTSLALWQSNDCPSASKATLMNMDKYFMWIHYERLHNHNKAKHNKTVCIFLGIYCMCVRGCGMSSLIVIYWSASFPLVAALLRLHLNFHDNH